MKYKKKIITYCTFIQSKHENLSPDITFCINITILNDYLLKIRTVQTYGNPIYSQLINIPLELLYPIRDIF
jgi:hypothetical protein